MTPWRWAAWRPSGSFETVMLRAWTTVGVDTYGVQHFVVAPFGELSAVPERVYESGTPEFAEIATQHPGPRAEQFIQLFDAKQIPWPLPTKADFAKARAGV